MTVNNWQAQDQTGSEYIGLFEIEHPGRPCEYLVFEVVKNDTHLIFGNCTNTGLLESGNFLIDDCFSIDENLQSLVEDIECYYTSGSVSDNFSCNDRMD